MSSFFRANSQHEYDALAFQQGFQIMADLNNTTPIAGITHLNGLNVCQTMTPQCSSESSGTMWLGRR